MQSGGYAETQDVDIPLSLFKNQLPDSMLYTCLAFWSFDDPPLTRYSFYVSHISEFSRVDVDVKSFQLPVYFSFRFPFSLGPKSLAKMANQRREKFIEAFFLVFTHSLGRYETTFPHVSAVPQMPRRKQLNCTICEWSIKRLTSMPNSRIYQLKTAGSAAVYGTQKAEERRGKSG